tara:strand:+ start:185 stop:565 length:381 start_codon:yes stop_codon:yes gene_type:complete
MIQVTEDKLNELINRRDYLTQLINDIQSTHFGDVDLPALVKKASILTPCSYEDIISNKRHRPLPDYRRIIWKILREDFELSFRKILDLFDLKNHSSIINGIDAITDYIQQDKNLKNDYLLIKEELL